MNLDSRLGHLSDMGVALWYSRARLRGAAPSPGFFYVTDDTIESSASESKEGAETNVGKPESQADPVSASEPAVVEKARTEVSLSELPEHHSSLGPQPELALNSFVSGSILVISETDALMPIEQEQQLLHNILIALGVTNTTCSFRGRFAWPVFSAENLPIETIELPDRVLGRWLRERLPDRICAPVSNSCSLCAS